MAYENMHRITTKQQEHIRDASNVGENTYDNLFKYEDVNHPNAVTSIENQSNSEVEEFNYDANGNVLLHEFDNGDTKNMLWDEANMLKAIKISNAGSFQHYIYDANGERTLKGLGQYGLMDLNGLSQTVSTIGNYSQYVSGYMVMGPHYMVTNHYYSGTERIACKLVGSVDSSVDNSLELSGTEKAGLPDRQAEDLELVRTEFGFDTLIIEDTDPEEDDCEGNNDCPNVLYFFHPDHIGSSTFLTDEAGNPYQFILYLPFGESMAEQKAGGYSTKYRFTGKEVDEETGLYYFGARYYDPRISLWYGVDPLAEKYPSWNPFNYTMNNPIRFIDPTGKETEESNGGGDPKKKDQNPTNQPPIPQKPVVNPKQDSNEPPSGQGVEIAKNLPKLEAKSSELRMTDRPLGDDDNVDFSDFTGKGAIKGGAKLAFGFFALKKLGKGAGEKIGKDAVKMTEDAIGDFLGDVNWHNTSAKNGFVNLFKKELKGQTNPDFYIDPNTFQVFLKTRDGKITIPTGQFHK